jgi:CHASE2 domain-containing sensor protein
MKGWQRKYLVRFISGMVGYSILLPLSLILVGDGRVEQPWLAVLVTLLPIAPFLNAMTAVLQNVRSQDELQRRIHLEAVLVTTLLTGALTFSYGLLEATELVPPLPTVFIAPFMIAVWGIANLGISRRYN